MAYLFEGDFMKKFIPFVLFCGFVLSTLFMSCEQLASLKNELTPSLSSITISQKPEKLSYDYEEALDLTGLVVKALYSDGSEKTVDGWTSDPKPWSKLTTTGTVTVTITYEEKTTSFTIKVSDKPAQKTLSSIYISKQADRLDYEYNSLFDLAGLEIKGKYSDGTEEVLEAWSSEPKAGTSLTTSGTVNVTITYEGKTTSFPITVAAQPAVISDNYFWGTWVRMDNGKEYEVLETKVVQGRNNYKITASDSTTLTVNSLGTFTKESDSVMICDSIPYYRKGGANIKYTIKVVGFVTKERANPLKEQNVTVTAFSEGYPNFVSEGKPVDESKVDGEEDGQLYELEAATRNSKQKIKIDYDNTELVVDQGLVNNNGDFMGTVALVGKDAYNLKITGTISDDQKDNGYLFGNNAKTYNMKLTITNISENECSSSGCIVKAADPNLKIESNDPAINLEGFTTPTMIGGATRDIELSLVYGEMTKPYVDTGITVTITNPFTQQEWNDYIPLRFFKGTIPITIAAKNSMSDSKTSLNGFVIYPDGNNQFFEIPNNSCKAVFIPTFGSEKPYKLVFSGATVTAELSENSEMYYTVEPASLTPRPVVTGVTTEVDFATLMKYMTFGGDNHTEDDAFSVNNGEGFEAFLRKGEIDYYSVKADSDIFYGPGGTTFYSVSYINENGDVPDTFLITEGDVLKTIHLPEITCDGYKFLGWYSEATKAIPDEYAVYDNITLTAKWQLESYPVVYELNGGTNHAANPSAYTIESSLITLEAPVRTGYDFGGWFVTDNFSDTAIGTIGGGAKGGITLYAKWTPVTYKITYELDGGTNAASNPATYTIETDTITLAAPQKKGFAFGGWYADNNFSGTKQTTIEKGSHVDKKYYAKWLKNCTVSFITAYGSTPAAIFVGEGEKLSAEQLPELTNSDYFFGGWYVGETSVTAESYTVTDDVTLTAKWSEKCTVSYVSDHGTAPQAFVVESGTPLTSANLPALTESDWKFLGWYTNSSYDEDKKVSAGQSVTASITLYAKWEEFIAPELTDSVVVLPAGTNGTAGTGAKYVLFGDWPQTIKADNVTVDENTSEIHGAFTYYSGSDGYWYVKCKENASYYTIYSNGTTVAQSSANSTKYFKVEPIKWRVLTENYNGTGKALLLAEKILTANVAYYDYSEEIRTINGSTVYPNNYKESKIRAYLNGLKYFQKSSSGSTTEDYTYHSKGFLQTAFSTDAQTLIATTTVDNSASSTTDSGNNITQATSYSCANTSDKIFLLSENEVTTSSYGFASYSSYGTGNTRIRVTTDFAKANYAYQNTSNGYCDWWWLRSPHCSGGNGVRDVYYNGEANNAYVTDAIGGVVPALTIPVTLIGITKCSVSYVTAHGTAPQDFDVENGTTLTTENLPALTEKGWKFLGWYTSSSFDEVTKASEGQSITESITLYAKWEEYAGPEVLPAGTDGSAGTNATYVLFGEWPQTIKTNNVTVNESVSEVHGAFTYYSGSDGYWYVKCRENAYESWYTYSNGTTVAQNNANSTKYFKVEPIKWRVLTEDYNGTGKALLLAESILTGNVPYYVNSSSRTINSSNVYANNYKYSTIRAYLNGTYESNDMQTNTYTNKGFLQTAFTTEAQSLIATTTVDNSAASTTDSGNNLNQATRYACANTSDKIFLLSEKEVTTSSYGFASYNSSATPNTRIRVTTDFAKANYAYYWASDGYGGWWWLRSPFFDTNYYALAVDIGGSVNYYRNDVYYTFGNVVPALTISLQ